MNCRICANKENNTPHRARERMFGLGDEFDYFECADCRCLQIAEFPADMSRYYPEGYYAYASPTGKNPLKKLLIRWRNTHAVSGRNQVGRLLYRIFPDEALHSLSRIPLRKDCRILDVGCGGGQLLSNLRDMGFQNTLGIDPFNASDIELENGLPILKRTLHEMSGTWDVIMFHHSFEHVPDPREILIKVAELLSDDGHCVIRIPISSSYAWRHYGVKWVQLDAPRHFFLHSVKSMEILAAEAKLAVAKINYDSTAFQFWGSEQYEKDIPLFSDRSYLVNRKQSTFTPSEISSFSKRADELNKQGEGDQAVFYLNPRGAIAAASPLP